MAVTPSYPGVYIQEASAFSDEIGQASTSETAFVDVFERGPLNVATRVASFGEFQAIFGERHRDSAASYGIAQFFLNGGSSAWVVRIAGTNAVAASVSTTHVDLVANGPGTWGNQLQAATQPSADASDLFDLVVRELATSTAAGIRQIEVFRGLSSDPAHPQFVDDVLQQQSSLARVHTGSASAGADASDVCVDIDDAMSITASANTNDPDFPAFRGGTFAGGVDDYSIDGPSALGIQGDPGRGRPSTGLYTLASESIPFNLLCLPAMSTFSAAAWLEAYATATELCERQRAFFIADPPSEVIDATQPLESQIDQLTTWFDAVGDKSENSAVYFPSLEIPDPTAGEPMTTEASGTIAGVYARTDSNRGVWKAPAGTESSLTNVLRPTERLNDAHNGALGQLGINAIRVFPIQGSVVWGARTMVGADLHNSEWKYVNVRRLALFIESSIIEGVRWAVFEPNDEATWSRLRHSITSFLASLYQQGAFSGTAASDSFFVRCDPTTTTPADQQQGRINVFVGFAPLTPTEFITIHIQLTSAA